MNPVFSNNLVRDELAEALVDSVKYHHKFKVLAGSSLDTYSTHLKQFLRFLISHNLPNDWRMKNQILRSN